MLTFSNRFHSRNSLRYIYRNGQTQRGQLFTLRYTHRNSEKTPRIAVVVSKKTAKHAVVRNRIRRRMYELFRAELKKIQPTSNIVCIIHSAETETTPHAILYSELRESLKQANLYKPLQNSDIIK